MDTRTIIDKINYKVDHTGIKDKPHLTRNEKYPYWYIGITNDPDRRRQEHADDGKNVKHWTQWAADDAREVETYFQVLGMKGDTGGSKDPTHVYIY